MSVLSKFNKSVKKGIEAGRINPERHGAIIEAGKKIARTMDNPDWPVIRGKIDNVSPSVFLKYCETLGLTELGKELPVTTEAEGNKPLSIVGNSRWRKQA